jgi:hypothetical protein
MNTKIKLTSMAIIAIISLSGSKLEAQDTNRNSEHKTTFSIETDPSTFAFGGYAFHFRIKPKNSQHLLLGAGTYGMEMPAFLINMNAENKDKGWNVRIKSAYALFGEYYLKGANHKWFVGLQVGMQNYDNTNDNVPGQASNYRNLLIMPSMGYTWQLFSFPLYFKPWLGLGYTSKISGDNTMDDITYNISPLVPFISLHVGYIIGN